MTLSAPRTACAGSGAKTPNPPRAVPDAVTIVLAMKPRRESVPASDGDAVNSNALVVALVVASKLAGANPDTHESDDDATKEDIKTATFIFWILIALVERDTNRNLRGYALLTALG